VYSSGNSGPLVDEAYHMRSCLYGRCLQPPTSVLRHLGSADENRIAKHLVKHGEAKSTSELKYEEPVKRKVRYSGGGEVSPQDRNNSHTLQLDRLRSCLRLRKIEIEA